MRKIITISSAIAVTLSMVGPAPAIAAEGTATIANQPETKTDSPQNGLSPIIETKTDRLGAVKSEVVRIYETPGLESTAEKAGRSLLGESFYIKKKVEIDHQTYYLLSTEYSSETGIIGWVKDEDLFSFEHGVKAAPAADDVFYLKENASGYSNHAWGGEKFLLNLGTDKGSEFRPAAVETVGDVTWYGGRIAGKEDIVWIEAEDLTEQAPQAPAVEKADDKEASPAPAENKKEAATSNSTNAPKTYARSTVAVETPAESKTSLLGHIRSTKSVIYPEIGEDSASFAAGAEYTNAVYYIKKQAVYQGKTYYLISQRPSSTIGVVGWIKAEDMSVREHKGVDRTPKQFIIKGQSSAFSKAWGGKKDMISNLSNFKGQIIQVHLTERAGNQIWYRGTLNGKTVWVHSSDVSSMQASAGSNVESKTSRLGHIKSSQKLIYKTPGNERTAFAAGTTYTNAVYYIKKQAYHDGVLYYLISKSPSSTKGVVGWMKASDMSTRAHKGVDKKQKTTYVKGSGKAYTKAWGGSKDVVYTLSKRKGEKFAVNLTEKTDSQVWYRGTLGGKTVWIHSNDVSTVQQTGNASKVINRSYTEYDLTLQKMAELQIKAGAQTDKRYKLWVSGEAFGSTIKNGKGTVQATYNVRRGPGTSYGIEKTVKKGTVLPLMDSTVINGVTWYYVDDREGWGTAEAADVQYYTDPSNFIGSFRDSLQFADLSSSADIDVDEVNEKVLKGMGVLEGRAQEFAEAGRRYGVNEIYLIAHALLETGNGKSELASGLSYKGKTVYNMYGIGAYDKCAKDCGTARAYAEGWTSPTLAIIGGAQFIGETYIHPHEKNNYTAQNTLYKMRWNPDGMVKSGYATHQYATDIGWAFKQTSKMNELYSFLDRYKINLIIPRLK